MQRSPDFEGTFHLLATGRRTPVASGYRPQHAIHENYQTSGEHTYLDREILELGQSAPVAVRFITPHVYPRCLWEGRELSVQEGVRVVGLLKVTHIINESLRVTPASYNSVWVAPPGLKE
jgi:translation elongation factor EF-Tu-like GTPase